MKTLGRFWVCWEWSPEKIKSGDMVLSFLRPSEEYDLRKLHGVQILCGRKLSQFVKEEARQIYISIVADMGLGRNAAGQALRTILCNEDNVSRWWFHKVSEKDCETQATFDHIIQVLTIRKVCADFNFSKINFLGAQRAIIEALRCRYLIGCCARIRRQFLLQNVISALFRRLKFGIKTIISISYLRRKWVNSQRIGDVVISGFWDWSVRKNLENEKIEDRYFKNLPAQLEKQGLSVTWLDQNGDPNSKRRSLAMAVDLLANEDRIVISQSFLQVKDVLRAIFNLGDIFLFFGFTKSADFHKIFLKDSFNFYPLFQESLWEGFCDAGMPKQDLVYLAHKRFAQRSLPKSVLSFLDFFLYARAVYAGVKAGSPSTVLFDMQHASCSREKMFYIFDADKEMNENIDQRVPQPDYIFTMGELGRKIFIGNGFSSHRVLATGSARYDYIGKMSKIALSLDDETIKILLVTSLDTRAEINMVDAAWRVFRDNPNVVMRLRSHPFADMRRHSRYRFYENKIIFSEGVSLDNDLAQAHIVIFSYSTVGEEAFLKGIPTWQWVFDGYNASVFCDIGMVPRFSSVEELTGLYSFYKKDRKKFVPSEDQQAFVAKECFCYDPKQVPSERIAQHIVNVLGRQ